MRADSNSATRRILVFWSFVLACALDSAIWSPMATSTKQRAMIRVGVGGWVFAPWRGTFYPPGLPQSRELEYASRQLTAIEINGTFYGSQKPASFRRWRDETPDDFVFALKGPRFATHRRELSEAGASIERFFASGVLELGGKLGPVLWQFPGIKRFEPEDFGAFLALLPARVEGRTIRHVVEVSHQSFAAPAFIDLLRKHGVALALVDSADRPAMFDVTADFVYARLRRSVEQEPAGYPQSALDAWAKRLKTWTAGGEPNDLPRIHAKPAPAAKARDCFVYFIGGAKVRAPAAAQALLRNLGNSQKNV
jgi:uncharacterized protein YecE (DUF72 family)